MIDIYCIVITGTVMVNRDTYRIVDLVYRDSPTVWSIPDEPMQYL